MNLVVNFECVCTRLQVVGMDCEWVSSELTQRDGTLARRRPVSLLQLASVSGVCVLVRLHLLQYIPDSLRQLLADRRCQTAQWSNNDLCATRCIRVVA